MLDVIASLVHLKLKYHNLQGEPTRIYAYLEVAKRIYEAIQKDQGESMALELKVISIIWKLNRMRTHPPKSS